MTMSTKNNVLTMIGLVAISGSVVAFVLGLQKSTLGDVLLPVAVSPVEIVPYVTEQQCSGCAGSAMDEIQNTSPGSIPQSTISQRPLQGDEYTLKITSGECGSSS